MFGRQKRFVQQLTYLAKEVKNTSSGKAQRLREMSGPALREVCPVLLPLCPSVCCVDVISERSNVFPSAMQPLKLIFKTKMDDYTIIFKNGDDLRQDQLVIQIFRLMDRLLKKENLDLKLIPYRVLATDLSNGTGTASCVSIITLMYTYPAGMVEFVHSAYPISAVISQYGNNIKVSSSNTA